MIRNLQQSVVGRMLLCGVCAALCVVVAERCVAEDGEKAKKVAGKASAQKTVLTKLTIEEENDALKFARDHHPELAKLLEQLKRKSKTGFARGTREVHATVLRLNRIREKQPARFDAELASWKTDSEIRLLTARWAISKNSNLEEQIQELLRKRQQAKIDRMKAERDKLAERLQQLDNQIGMGTTELEADLASEWGRLSKRAAVTAKARKPRSPKKTVTPRPTKDTITKPKS